MIDKDELQMALCYSDIRNEQSAFLDGIDWFKENLWHDASEVPDKRKYILVEYSNKRVCREAFVPYEVQWVYKDFTGEPWKKLAENEKITRWLYIDDLINAK